MDGAVSSVQRKAWGLPGGGAPRVVVRRRHHAADAAAPNGYVSDVVFISKTGFETRSYPWSPSGAARRRCCRRRRR